MMTLFVVLMMIGALVYIVHDWVHIPGWTHGRQVYAAIGPTKMWLGTLFNGLLTGIPVGLAIYYWHRPRPNWVLNFFIGYCAFVIMGAIQSWWLPYFRGTDAETQELYKKMYAGTYQVLPAHGDKPRPNLFHLFLHALGLTNLVLAIALRFHSA